MQIEKQTGSKPLQVRVQQGKEPAHLLALFDGSMVIHHTLASLPPSASSRLPDASDQRGAGGSSALKEAKGRGRLYAVAGTHASRAYCVQVDANATTLNSSTCYVLYTASGAVFLWLGHWTDMQQRSIAAHVARRHEESAGGAFRVTTVHERQETREFWDALGAGAIGADYVCAGYLREVPWWRPRLFGCKAVTQVRLRGCYAMKLTYVPVRHAVNLDGCLRHVQRPRHHRVSCTAHCCRRRCVCARSLTLCKETCGTIRPCCSTITTRFSSGSARSATPLSSGCRFRLRRWLRQHACLHDTAPCAQTQAQRCAWVLWGLEA